MGVPPTGRPPSTPPSKGRDRPEESDDSSKKEFRLPKGKPEKKKDEGTTKKKDLFDLVAGEGPIKEVKEQISKGESIKAEAVEKMEAGSAKAQISQIGEIIQKMVDTMQVGKVGGKDFASLDLSTKPDVPESFAGSSLTLSFEENGLVIRFDNFMTPQQEQMALNIVEQNKDQLTQMIQALQGKNIQVAELNIGDRQVALPRVEALPPPFQPTPPEPEPETGGERRGGRGERQEPEGGDEPS